MSNQNQVELTIPELKDLLTYIIKNNRHIQSQGKNPAAVQITADSGIGKTSTSMQLANELKLNFIKLNLAQIEELGDLVGFPHKEFEVIKSGENGAPDEIRWVAEEWVPTYIQNKYKPSGQMRMTHAAPQWIQGKETGGLLILDDWNRADMRFIQAIMELVDRQEYHSWKLPKDWHILLTANPDDGDYLVNSIDVAQMTRFISVKLKFDLEAWAEWAESNQIDSRCINFMLAHATDLMKDDSKKATNPRSVTTFFNAITSIPDFEKDLPLIQIIGEGSVGPEFASMFTAFINNRMDKLISPKDILLDKDENKVIAAIRSALGKGDSYRADISSVMVTRIINWGLLYAETNPINQEHIDRLVRLITEEDLFQVDTRFHLARKFLNGNVKFKPLCNNQKAAKYMTSI